MYTLFMKNILLLLITLLFFSSCDSKSGVDLWLHDYDNALEIAKKEQKDVYLFIGADECRFCDKYKEQTLSKKHVIDKLKEDYILLYLSRDQHQIPDRFETQGVPRHYFLTPEGKIILDTHGMPEPEGLFLILDEVDLHKDD